MAQSRGYTFVVEGRGRFPFDMLRYDCCYPLSSEDVANLEPWEGGTVEELLRHSKDATRRVALRSDHHYEPTEARWRSFGWRVVEGSVLRTIR